MANLVSPREAERCVELGRYHRQELLGTLLGNALGAIWLWCVRRRTRQRLVELLELDRRLLTDVGIDPHQARAEAAKPFWRA
jgi:uncharacterized protein YjiS (DUF1127 family)